MREFLCGQHSVIEALKAKRRQFYKVYLEGSQGRAKDLALVEIRKYGVSVQIADRNHLNSLAAENLHQGIVAEVSPYPYVELEDMLKTPPSPWPSPLKGEGMQQIDPLSPWGRGPGRGDHSRLFLAADSLQDPQNLGAICRAAYCFGVDGIIVNKDRSVQVTPTVSRASAGAVELIPVSRVVNLARTLDMLKEKGFWIYGAAADAKQGLHELDRSPKTVLVVGREGKGIRDLVGRQCDFLFKIPMARPFDSLNVAQATSIALYEIMMVRRHKGP